MTTSTPSNELTPEAMIELLPDYLNGHLTSEVQQRITQALDTNEALRQELGFQRALQSALRNESQALDAQSSATAAPSFTQIANRLEPSTPGRLLQRVSDWWSQGNIATGAWAMAALLVVTVTAGLFEQAPSQPNNDYKTLTSTTVNEQPAIALLPISDTQSAEFQAVLGDYGLELQSLLPGSNIARVTPINADTNLHTLAAALAADNRVRMAQVIEASPNAAATRDRR